MLLSRLFKTKQIKEKKRSGKAKSPASQLSPAQQLQRTEMGYTQLTDMKHTGRRAKSFGATLNCHI
jgi:hypothetical protein